MQKERLVYVRVWCVLDRERERERERGGGVAENREPSETTRKEELLQVMAFPILGRGVLVEEHSQHQEHKKFHYQCKGILR